MLRSMLEHRASFFNTGIRLSTRFDLQANSNESILGWFACLPNGESIEFSGLESDQSTYRCIVERGFATGTFLRSRVVRSGKDHVVGIEKVLGPDLPHDERTEYADDGEDSDLYAETSQIGDGRSVVHVHLLSCDFSFRTSQATPPRGIHAFTQTRVKIT